MRQRGRKSSAELVFPVIEHRPRVTPPSSLTKAERSLFIELAANAEHLRPTDTPLLASYVQATIASRRSARDPSKVDVWEKATRLQMSLVRNCQIAEEPKGVLINTASKQQFTYKDACVEHDPHVNHDAEATRAATSAVEDLLKAAFKLE